MSIPFSIILIASYGAYLASSIFKLGSRRHAHSGSEPEPLVGEAAGVTVGGAIVLGESGEERKEFAEELTEEEAADEKSREQLRALRRQKPLTVAMLLVSLGAVTIASVIIAGILVSVTDHVIQSSPVLTPLSVGLILLPIVCNLGEQSGSIVSAWHNRMEAAMSVAAGSSVQVALFVTPVLALLSYPLSMGDTSLVLTLISPDWNLWCLG